MFEKSCYFSLILRQVCYNSVIFFLNQNRLNIGHFQLASESKKMKALVEWMNFLPLYKNVGKKLSFLGIWIDITSNYADNLSTNPPHHLIRP